MNWTSLLLNKYSLALALLIGVWWYGHSAGYDAGHTAGATAGNAKAAAAELAREDAVAKAAQWQVAVAALQAADAENQRNLSAVKRQADEAVVASQRAAEQSERGRRMAEDAYRTALKTPDCARQAQELLCPALRSY